MGLVCWLPLDKSTLVNKGYGDLEVLETVSGYNLTTPVNATTLTTGGKFVNCRSFNGSNSLIAIGGDDLFNCFTGGSQQFSICFWLYNGDGNGSANSSRAVWFGDYNTTGCKNINLEKTAAGLVRWYWTSDAAIGAMSSTTVDANAWSHVCITYSGTVFKCYVNGIEKYTKNQVLPTLTKRTSGYFFLGRDQRTGDTVFNGKMNDFRVYDHCLSLKEVKDIYKCLYVYYALNFEDTKALDGTYPTTAATWTDTDNSGVGGDISYNNIVSNSDTASGSRSAKFNGSNSYIEKIIPGNSSAYTFMCWVKFDTTGTFHLMDCRNTANSQGLQPFYCGLSYGNQFYSINGGSLQTSAATCGFSTSDTNKWFHLAGVVTTTGCKLYINGQLKHSNTATKTNPTVWGDLPFRVGTRLNGQNWFNGKVAEVRVYLSELSADDILDLYQTKAYILKNNSLHAGQFIETATTDFGLPTKNYVVNANEYRENSSEVGLYNGDTTTVVPEGYTLLEYIQSNGSQYINTDYYWHSEVSRVYAHFKVTTQSTYRSLWGNEEYVNGSTSTRYFGGIPHGGSNGSYSYYVGSGSPASISIPENTEVTIETNTTADKKITIKKNGTVVTNAVSYSGTIQTYNTATTVTDNTGKIFIFANHNSGTNGNTSTGTQVVAGMALYEFKMWDNNILVRDFIPVKNPNNIPGLYDRVEDKFYPSSTATAFTAPGTVYSKGSYKLKAKEIIEIV